jgi:hypothetical protein
LPKLSAVVAAFTPCKLDVVTVRFDPVIDVETADPVRAADMTFKRSSLPPSGSPTLQRHVLFVLLMMVRYEPMMSPPRVSPALRATNKNKLKNEPIVE